MGYLPVVTHAQALVGATDGTYERALGRVSLQAFASGPAAIEALVGGHLDASYVGAAPAATAFVRSEGMARVVAGAVTGGSVFVLRPGIEPGALRGTRLAAPQIGNTQDVALRHWLRQRGLSAGDSRRADVLLFPLANSEILSLFRQGELDGAWVPEPWGARLVREAHGVLWVDERDLWPGGRAPTTVLMVSTRALASRRREVLALLTAHVELTERWRADPGAFERATGEAFRRQTGQPLQDEVLHEAFSRMSPVLDPLERELAEVARRSMALGYLPSSELKGLVDPAPLREAAPKEVLGAAGPRPR